MSKSLGNVVSPSDVIEKIGIDGLRLWVASIGTDKDAVFSQKVLDNVAEVLRKVRNTCRFLLSNLYDFSYEVDAVDLNQLHPTDAYALWMACRFQERMLQAYAAYNYTVVYHGLADFCAASLSALYLDITKDRLYADAASGWHRRSAQTAYWHILDMLTRLMAPIMSCTAELVSDEYQMNKKQSVHLQTYSDTRSLREKLGQSSASVTDLRVLFASSDQMKQLHADDADFEHEALFDYIMQIRAVVLKALEVSVSLARLNILSRHKLSFLLTKQHLSGKHFRPCVVT